MEATDYGQFLRLSMLDGDEHLPKVQSGEPLKAQDAAFVRAVRECGQQQQATGPEVREVHQSSL